VTHAPEIDSIFLVSISATIRYDTIEEFNVDSKAEYLAHVAIETKTNKASAPLIQYRLISMLRVSYRILLVPD